MVSKGKRQVTVKRHSCLLCGSPCTGTYCRSCFSGDRYRWTRRYNKKVVR